MRVGKRHPSLVSAQGPKLNAGRLPASQEPGVSASMSFSKMDLFQLLLGDVHLLKLCLDVS